MMTAPSSCSAPLPPRSRISARAPSAPAVAPGDKAAGGDDAPPQRLPGAVPAAIGDQRARPRRARDKRAEDPALDPPPRRQPPEGQQEDRSRKWRLGVLIQHQPAAMVG